MWARNESLFFGLFEENLRSQNNVRDSFRLKLYLIQNEVLHLTPPSTTTLQCASMPQKKFSTSTIWHIKPAESQERFLAFTFCFSIWSHSDLTSISEIILFCKTYTTAVPQLSTTALPPLNSVTFLEYFVHQFYP